MKITLKKIVESKPALDILLLTKLPVKVSYRLAKLDIKLQAEMAVYESQRVSLVKKFGEQIDSKTDSWQVPADRIQDYKIEFDKLQGEEIEIDFEKIKLEDLGDISIEPKNLPEFIFE